MMSLRPRGKNFHFDYMLGRVHAIRGTLGTSNRAVANRLKDRIETALIEGAGSSIWSELLRTIPRDTFLRLSSYAGVKTEVVATWSELLTAYQDHMDRKVAVHDLTEGTVKNYRSALRRFDFFLNERTTPISLVTDITPRLVDEYRFMRLASIQEKKGERGGAGFTQESAALHGAFEYAIRHKLACHNPFTSLKNRKSEERGAQPYDGNELMLLRKHAGGEWLIFIVLRWTGLRESDAATLAWKEVSFETGEIIKLTQKSKYQKRAIIPMDKELIAVLEQEFQARNPNPDDLVLLHDKPMKPMTKTHLMYRVSRLAKRAGIAKGTPHRFRDTFAVDMFVCRNQKEHYIAEMLGDTVETVRKCYLPYVSASREDAKRLLHSGTRLEDFDVSRASQL